MILTVLGALTAPPLQAAPHVPGDEKMVLETLPVRAGDPLQRELRQLRAKLAGNPADLETATRLAERYYRLALAEGDPRYIGYAQAALTPWWNSAEVPVDVFLLRAGLRQYRHEFDLAMADLDRAVARAPGDGRLRALRASLFKVRGDYVQARRECTAMGKAATPLILAACLAGLDALQGQAGPAHDRLERLYADTREATREERLWVLARLAEMAQWRGHPEAAERHFSEAQALGLRDVNLLANFADFLLDAGRYREVIKLLNGETRNDVSLLRLALAERALGLASARQHEQELKARFEAARRRGDKLHLQDEARFALVFENRPREALALALENWGLQQREPGDARIILEAALAAGDPEGARPALEWLARTGHEDGHLLHLAGRLRGGSR